MSGNSLLDTEGWRPELGVPLACVFARQCSCFTAMKAKTLAAQGSRQWHPLSPFFVTKPQHPHCLKRHNFCPFHQVSRCEGAKRLTDACPYRYRRLACSTFFLFGVTDSQVKTRKFLTIPAYKIHFDAID